MVPLIKKYINSEESLREYMYAYFGRFFNSARLAREIVLGR